METTFVDNFFESTGRSNNIILCQQIGNNNKNNFPKVIFVFTFTTPITEVLHDPEIPVGNKKLISAVLSFSIFHIFNGALRAVVPVWDTVESTAGPRPDRVRS